MGWGIHGRRVLCGCVLFRFVVLGEAREVMGWWDGRRVNVVLRATRWFRDLRFNWEGVDRIEMVLLGYV